MAGGFTVMHSRCATGSSRHSAYAEGDRLHGSTEMTVRRPASADFLRRMQMNSLVQRGRQRKIAGVIRKNDAITPRGKMFGFTNTDSGRCYVFQ